MSIATQPDSYPQAMESPWHPWTPTKSEPWGLRRVIHLHRRAGFAGTWNEIERDLKSGHQASIKRFLEGNAYESAVPDDFYSLADLIGSSAVGSDNPNRLQAWWIYRMIYSPDPLGERLALMWHNHFATSNAKVDSLRAMLRQNEMFRKYGRDNFGQLFSHVMKDPAILIYLDANSNRAEHPNENLGREMLELFSIGQGNFTESDVKNAAKALSGWTVINGQFEFNDEFHHDGEKTLLGKTGEFKGDDAVQIALDHPATASRIAGRVCEMLMGEQVVTQNALDELAKRFRNKDLNLSWLVETILKSKLFFSDANIGNRIVSPAEFVVGCIRGIGAMTPPPSTLILVDWLARTGHRIFYPPNVFGFPGGRKWINSQWLIARNRFVYELLAGKVHRHAYDPTESFRTVIDSEQQMSDAAFCCSLLLNVDDKTFSGTIEDASKGNTTRMLQKILTSTKANLG